MSVYHISTEDIGEWDAFFDEAGDLLTYWHGNDATWRSEYMNPLLHKLGIRVLRPKGQKYNKMYNTLVQKIISDHGYDPREE